MFLGYKYHLIVSNTTTYASFRIQPRVHKTRGTFIQLNGGVNLLICISTILPRLHRRDYHSFVDQGNHIYAILI